LEGQRYCSVLFALEKEWAELTAEERHRQRQERAKPVLDALLAGSRTAAVCLWKSAALSTEQWPWLIRNLEDGRLEISNKRAERSIKPFVMGRKNFLFAITPGGAQGSAMIFSLIETAKENKLDPFRHLVWVMQTAPVLSTSDSDWALELLPENAPAECRPAQKRAEKRSF